jgi:hypothetical protein
MFSKVKGGKVMSDGDGVLAMAVFASFLQWAASQPNAEVLLTQMTLVNSALAGVDVDRGAARMAALSLAEAAQYGPTPEVMVPVFDMMAEALALG